MMYYSIILSWYQTFIMNSQLKAGVKESPDWAENNQKEPENEKVHVVCFFSVAGVLQIRDEGLKRF